MLRKLRNLITLRPYGDVLCASATRVWTFFAAIGVLLICITESSAWAYVGFFLASGRLRYFAAFVLGLIAAAAIAVVDISFLTLDLRRGEYQRMVDNLDAVTDSSGKNRLLVKLRSPAVGVLVRLAMVFGSLAIAAPYVSQLFFSSDVSAVLAREHSVAVQAQRAELVARHDREITQLKEQADNLRSQLVNETAGKGPSRRFGRGPTAQTMEAQLHDIETQVSRAEAAKDGELRKYDGMAPADLARIYGVVSNGEGIQARNMAMEVIKMQPGYRHTEWTIRALLAGLFLVLLVLKAYQPNTAKVYYSEFCQDAYRRYRTGEFDQLLPDQQKSTAAEGMTCLAFDIWLKSDYKDHLRLMRNSTILASIVSNQKLTEKNIQEIHMVAESDMAPLLVDLERVHSEAEQLEQEIMNSESELKAVEADMHGHNEAIEKVDAAIFPPKGQKPYPGSADGFARALEKREMFRDSLIGLEKNHRALALSVEKTRARLKTKQEEIQRIQAAIDARASVITNAQSRINDSRNRAVDEIDGRVI